VVAQQPDLDGLLVEAAGNRSIPSRSTARAIALASI
jgi:hypothetical protein